MVRLPAQVGSLAGRRLGAVGAVNRETPSVMRRRPPGNHSEEIDGQSLQVWLDCKVSGYHRGAPDDGTDSGHCRRFLE